LSIDRIITNMLPLKGLSSMIDKGNQYMEIELLF